MAGLHAPQRLAFFGIFSATLFAAHTAFAQIRNPCNVITKVEAEAIVGGPLIGPQPSPQGTLCKYYEAGYGESPSKIRLVTIGVWIGEPDGEAINTRRLAAIRDSSLLPLQVKELPGPGDGAVWVWAGNRLGALYAFRGGTTEVAVKISGVRQDLALATAKKWAIRALGSASRSSFAYNGKQVAIDYRDYYAPRIMSALYLGVFSQIADDPLTRSYIRTLAQSFNSTCPSIPNSLALLEYGYYNEYNGQVDMFKSARAGNIPKFFNDFVNMFKRVRPKVVDVADADAQMFIVSQQEGEMGENGEPDPNDCMTPQIQRLYENIAELAQERRHIPPDVENDAAFLAQLRPDAQRANGFDPRAPHPPSGAQLMKKGCTTHTAGAAASGFATDMEKYCRCLVDAAVMANIPDAEMRTMGASFDDRSIRSASDRYPAFARERSRCYH
jgi:hypothetical protein